MAREIEARLKLSAIDRTKKAFDSVSRNLDRIEKKTKQVERAERASARADRINAVSAAAAGAESRILGFGRAVGVLATGVGAQKFIATTSDFESALTEIQKKAGTTAEETQKLGEIAKDLATSGEVAVSLEEILSAMERGAAAGLPLEELREFAKLSAMAADAFEMSAEEVGNAAAGFKVSMGIPVSEMEEYFGLINKLADSGIASESNIINFLDRAAASLQMFGLTAEQTAAYAATLDNIKMAPDVAANALSSLAGKLLSPGSDKAQDALHAIVGDLDDFQDILRKDANKALLFFLDRLNELDKFEANKLLNAFVGAGFDDEVLRLAKASDEVRRNLEIAASRDSWAEGLSETYRLKLDDFWSQWEIFSNTVKELTIDAGTMGLPALKDGLQGAKVLVQEIGAGFETFGDNINTDALDEASKAISDLKTQIDDLLGLEGVDASESELQRFFREFAETVNQVSGYVEALSKNIGDIVEFSKDPIGFLQKDRSAEELQDRFGITKLTPAEVEAARLARMVEERQATEDLADQLRIPEVPEEMLTAPPGPVQGPLNPADYEPWLAAPSLGLRVGPYTPDELSEAAADEQWRRMQTGGEGVDPSRFGETDVPEIEGIDELRHALDEGSTQLPLQGQQAGEAIAASAAGLADSMRSAADYIAAQIRSALQTPVNVKMPSGGSVVGSMAAAPKANRAKATTMEDAGTAGGG